MIKHCFTCILFLLLLGAMPAGYAQAPERIETHKEGIIENLFGPGDEEFVCYNKVHRNFYSGIFGLTIALAVAIYGRYHLKMRMANKLELKNKIIEEKNKDITDSISYAKYLQEAILPPIDRIGACFQESFVYYKPKDIVAGDFYWLEVCEDWTFIAVADCTGHGVPGALVSVVCSNALNMAVKEFGILDTGKILDKTREMVKATFEKSANEIADGMDISLLAVNKKEQLIRWSGANNPLWFYDGTAIQKIKADKQPIGKTHHPHPFTTHTIDYNKGNIFYLFTDGYADQFGGPEEKKLKHKPLETLLAANTSKPLSEQHKIVNDNFDNWKGHLQQIDDVTIIGVKV